MRRGKAEIQPIRIEGALNFVWLLGVLLAAILLATPLREAEMYLLAISVGAVFMGANTYIGNAPNFMVKAISEEWKCKVPSFPGYMLWSGFILIPIFVLVTIIFFW